MQIKLTPSYYLTDEIGETPRLVNRLSQEDYGPDDIKELYSSWGLQPVRNSVRRAAARVKLNEQELALVERFVRSGTE